ncbi:PemK-like protein [Halorhabdus tiamatea SARL4B]|uniref:Plasmid maintenance toxin/cell growth inhibitor n=1 Tax=Halorhabdus tiamatea SARL4B TaxID=1033806 RepID=F7PF44_9EURY|nr:type II toxin-antitoxin system PemK/MazF family toxin [Halorhabdus tiamatea]ERJ06034.1 PemK-like protein [Halorhabdus tiamatea SARL4B]CCQ34405.1 plasmid maintenance toxin/cell growth inhibitor [Halorhabdus tiamatea SARL4B]
MAYAQGSVVIAPATFKRGRRPYLVVSNADRPFVGDRYTVAVITSTERDDAVPIAERSLTEGELKTDPSYVSPWSLHVFPEQDIVKRVAQVDTGTMRTVADQIQAFTRVL